MSVIIDLDGQKYEMDYYKDYIRDIFPVIEKIQFSDANEQRIQRSFLKRLQTINKSVTEKGSFKADMCLFDLVFDAHDGIQNQIVHLKWLNEQLSIIVEKLDKQLFKKFKNTLVDLFINFDDAESRYLSRAGEVGFLSRILNMAEVTVVDIEQELPNGKSVDFVIQTSFDERPKLIEVYSIDVNINKIRDSNGLRVFLDRRLAGKFKSKGEGLRPIPFVLAPILWAEDIHSLYKFEDAFSLFKEFQKWILPPLGLYYYKLATGNVVCVFEPITNVIERRRKCEEEQGV